MVVFRSLASGSSGNAFLLKTDRVSLLFEAGLRLTTLDYYLACEDIDASRLDAVFISHEHKDHCMGAGELAGEHGTRIYASAEVLAAAGMSGIPSTTPLKAGETVEIGDVAVETFPIDHDSVRPIGFLVRAEGRTIVLATDLGRANDAVYSAIAEADLVVLESNHDPEMLRTGSYPRHLQRRVSGPKGHLSNMQAGLALARCLRKNSEVWLAHLSQENNTPTLALKTVRAHLGPRFASAKISVVRRDRPSARWTGNLPPMQLSLFGDHVPA